MSWPAGPGGVVVFPSGRTALGRSWRTPVPEPVPTVGVYLGARPPTVPGNWPQHWLGWPDFRPPRDPAAARSLLRQLWQLAESERLEVACRGGRGRTGTVLACWAVLDGLSPSEAIAYVRARYDAHAVETPGQRRFVASMVTDAVPS